MADAVQRLLELLRLRTVSAEGPGGAYVECAEWLQLYLEEIGLDVRVFSLVENAPIVLATWRGKDASLPSIVLNSHYDVVPAMPEHWQFDPFDAQVLDDGRIYGRGAQDMKSVCVQYAEAVRKLKSSGFVPERDVHLLYVPDEEIGGPAGMQGFIESQAFHEMLGPVAFALDEGLANTGDKFTVFYGERTQWALYVKAKGPTGHGSRFIQHTATQKLIDVCNKALAFRAEQEQQLGAHEGCKHAHMKKKNLGDVTTVNLTMLQSGVSSDGGKTYALNVIPTDATAGFDIRIAPGLGLDDFETILNEWCSAEGVSWEFDANIVRDSQHYVTSLESSENEWWPIFRGACEAEGLELETEIFPAATDSRFLRKAGIPSLGFSPMNRTPVLLHDHDESLHKDVFLRGIEIYAAILRAMLSHR